MVARVPFGIDSSVRSTVRMRVERRLISSTVPTRPLKLQVSPTRITSSPNREIPPNRFSIVFCAETDGEAADAESGERGGQVETKHAHNSKGGGDDDDCFGDTLSEQNERTGAGAAAGDGAFAQPIHAAREQAQRQPAEADDEYHARRDEVIMAVQKWHAEITDQDTMNHHSEHQPDWPGDFSPIGKLWLLAVLDVLLVCLLGVEPRPGSSSREPDRNRRADQRDARW